MRPAAKGIAWVGAAAVMLLVFGQPKVGAQVFRGAVEAIVRLAGIPLPASRAVLSEHEIDQINRMSPQGQAERLLERALNHYEGAALLIEERVDSWRGVLQYKEPLSTLLYTANNSSDLRVRAAAAEVGLAAYGLAKTPATVDDLTISLDQSEGDRANLLWSLGLLGSRGVEPARVFDTLRGYLSHPDEETRKWAVNSLAMLGSDETIPVLLDVFRYDTSLVVKERAACSLAETGMLAHEQRWQAVPDFLRLMDDPGLDATARGWAFQALRDITGESIGDDPNAWRDWAAGAGAG